jgi:hypothetical protein
MYEAPTPSEISEIEDEMARIDALLRPIATRRVDTSDPDYETKLRQSRPLEEAGVRAEAEAALRAVIALYAEGDDTVRAAVRALFNRYTSFRWAVHVPHEPTPESFRFALLHFSALDQGPDARDELLGLRDLCAEAEEAGIDIAPMLAQIALLSSDVNRYGMGSTREFLLRAGGRIS